MARKEKSNVEYFPHSVNHGKKMFCLRSKYKNDGYAVWFMLIEHLGKADNHYLDLKDDVQMIYLSSDLMVDEVVLLDIINMLVKLQVFDAELWNKERILYNEEFVESINDAYKKRNNECINRNSLILLLSSKGRWKLDKSNPKLNNPDLKEVLIPKEKKRKENEIKEEENKEDESAFLNDFILSIFKMFDETNSENLERTYKSNKPNIKNRLSEFIEIEQVAPNFKERPLHEILKHFRNWLKYNEPLKVTVKPSDDVPWASNDMTGVILGDPSINKMRDDRWNDYQKRLETDPNAVY